LKQQATYKQHFMQMTQLLKIRNSFHKPKLSYSKEHLTKLSTSHLLESINYIHLQMSNSVMQR